MLFAKALAALMLAALALMAFVLLYGIIICPVRPGKGEQLEAVLHVNGSAPGLENTLRGLVWLRSSGRVYMNIVVIDEGMDADTRQTARLLCNEKNGAVLLSEKGAPAERGR